MEWLSQAIEKIIQSQIWRFVVSHFSWVDWVTLAFLAGGLLYGARHGLLRVLVLMAETLLIAFVTFLYDQKVSRQLHALLSFIPDNALPAVGFITVAFPLIFLVQLIDSRASQLFRTSLAGPVRVIGGGVAGFLYGAFLWSFVFQFLLLLPLKPFQKSASGASLSRPLIAKLAPEIYRKIKR